MKNIMIGFAVAVFVWFLICLVFPTKGMPEIKRPAKVETPEIKVFSETARRHKQPQKPEIRMIDLDAVSTYVKLWDALNDGLKKRTNTKSFCPFSAYCSDEVTGGSREPAKYNIFTLTDKRGDQLKDLLKQHPYSDEAWNGTVIVFKKENNVGYSAPWNLSEGEPLPIPDTIPPNRVVFTKHFIICGDEFVRFLLD